MSPATGAHGGGHVYLTPANPQPGDELVYLGPAIPQPAREDLSIPFVYPTTPSDPSDQESDMTTSDARKRLCEDPTTPDAGEERDLAQQLHEQTTLLREIRDALASSAFFPAQTHVTVTAEPGVDLGAVMRTVRWRERRMQEQPPAEWETELAGGDAETEVACGCLDRDHDDDPDGCYCDCSDTGRDGCAPDQAGAPPAPSGEADPHAQLTARLRSAWAATLGAPTDHRWDQVARAAHEHYAEHFDAQAERFTHRLEHVVRRLRATEAQLRTTREDAALIHPTGGDPTHAHR